MNDEILNKANKLQLEIKDRTEYKKMLSHPMDGFAAGRLISLRTCISTDDPMLIQLDKDISEAIAKSLTIIDDKIAILQKEYDEL